MDRMGKSDDIDREKVVAKKHLGENTWVASRDGIGCGDGIKKGGGRKKRERGK